MIILSGESLRNVKYFGKMDPYVVVESNNIKYKTYSDDEGDVEPVWNHSFYIPLLSFEDEMKVSVFHDGLFIDECIGTATIGLESLLSNNNGYFYVKIFHKGANAGELRLSCLV